jgi:GDP-mannose transporter
MSFVGFALRESVSATTFTFVGVVCKFATVLANQLVWAHHGSATGALMLCASIVLSSIYVAPIGRAVLENIAKQDSPIMKQQSTALMRTGAVAAGK